MGAPQYEQAGADIGGTGTTNTIPRWTGPSTLGDSGLIDNGTAIYTTTRNVGIGTASPGARLHSVAADGTYQFAVSGTTRAVRFLTNAAGANIEGVDPTLSASYQPLTIGGSTVTLANSGSPALTVNTSGNVGVGTTSPASALHVRNNTAGITLDSTLGGGRQYQLNPLRTGLSNSGFEIRDVTAGAAVISIDASQQVGIGTASPIGTLDVRATNPTIVCSNSATRYGYQVWNDAASEYRAGTGGSFPFVFLTANTERARIDSSGNLILNTASTGATIQAAGSQQGLKLPATPGNTDPNTLDCYADGGTANSGGVTWTPELRFGGATTGIAYNFRVGRYTRIGNMIFAQAHITLSSKGTATGNATVAGLPTMSNTPDLYAAAAIGYVANLTIGAQATGLMFQNSSQVTLYKSASNANPTQMADTDFANNSVLIFTICYPVT